MAGKMDKCILSTNRWQALWLVGAVVWSLAAGPLASAEGEEQTLWLDEMDLSHMDSGWQRPRPRRAVSGYPMAIADVAFPKGVGANAISAWRMLLDGKVQRFVAQVGVDDHATPEGQATVEFFVFADGQERWRSGVMRSGDAARAAEVELAGVRQLVLYVSDGDDGVEGDHFNWADARFFYSGEPPEPVHRFEWEAQILTPPPPDTPRINGARVFGARPGAPFLFTIPATGARPMRFAAQGLPEGVALDAETGRLSGAVVTAGEHAVVLTAKNALGETTAPLRVVIGETIALTPPMGWNSWNCWAEAVDDDKIRRAARALVDSGLINHGWTYVNIDDTWQAPRRGGPHNAIQGAEKFPDMAALCEYVHDQGLKIGIYSTPWAKSYAGYLGGSSDHADGSWSTYEAGWSIGEHSFAAQDARQFAEWGMDYLKYDWSPNDVHHAEEMAKALRATGRDIVFSLSNTAPFELASEWARLANCWRTTEDILDNWQSLATIGFSQDRWRPYAGPGHWNDPDMLVVGQVGWGPELRPTGLTADEQYTHISLWCLLSAPLLLGCDLEQLDPFTLNLLTNDEVLAVNQDPLGRQAARLVGREGREVWAKPLEDGSLAVGLFNRWPVDIEVTATWDVLGLEGPALARDLWRQEDLGVFDDAFAAMIPTHGVRLVRLATMER